MASFTNISQIDRSNQCAFFDEASGSSILSNSNFDFLRFSEKIRQRQDQLQSSGFEFSATKEIFNSSSFVNLNSSNLKCIIEIDSLNLQLKRLENNKIFNNVLGQESYIFHLNYFMEKFSIRLSLEKLYDNLVGYEKERASNLSRLGYECFLAHENKMELNESTNRELLIYLKIKKKNHMLEKYQILLLCACEISEKSIKLFRYFGVGNSYIFENNMFVDTLISLAGIKELFFNSGKSLRCEVEMLFDKFGLTDERRIENRKIIADCYDRD